MVALRPEIRGPTTSTRPGFFVEDLESQAVLGLPVVYPPQAVSSRGIVPPGIFRSIHTHIVHSRTMIRIHSMIRASFRHPTETLPCWNRLGRSPVIRPGLLAVVTTFVLIPVSCSLQFSHANYVASFTVLVVAIHPLVYLLTFVIDDLAIRYGETMACLLHATTVNAVEVIVAVVGLIRNEPQAVHVSLLGSFIINTLLIPGLCFFFGGIRLSNQHFDRMTSHSKSPMVVLSFIAFILPSTLDHVNSINKIPNAEQREAAHSHLADRLISIIMFLTYVGHTISQLLLEPREDGSTSIAVDDSASNPAGTSINQSSPGADSPDSDEATFLESGTTEERYSRSETPMISATTAVIILFGVCGVCQSRCMMPYGFTKC
ncbi:hypothetical protein EDB87DRAFT_1619747 [Lactarius vividus]|nr:hypothetical protein EDB87DRAFT_1619747 [Lactarius vividus]